jgi:hypothetical protein
MRSFAPIAAQFTLAVLLVAGACRSQQSDELESQLPDLKPPRILETLDVETSPGDPVLLAYKPVGKVAWSVSLVQRSQQARGESKATSGSRQKFTMESTLAESGQTLWVQEMRMRNVTVEPLEGKPDKVAGESTNAVRSALEMVKFKVKSDATGRVLDVSLEGTPAAPFKGMKKVVEKLVRESAVSLPDRPVAPGESWETESMAEADTDRTASVVESKYNSVFLGWTECGTSPGRCAVIRTTGQFTIGGTLTGKAAGESSGTGRTDSVVVLNLEQGRVEKCGVTGTAVQRFAIKGKDGGPVFTDTLDTEAEWVLAPANAPEAKSEPAKEPDGKGAPARNPEGKGERAGKPADKGEAR